MNPTLWSILGGSLAITCEMLYRKLPGPWLDHWYFWVPLTIGISVCVHGLVNAPGVSLIASFIVYTSTTLVLRTLVCLFILHDKVTPGTWVAIVLLVIARIIQQVWK
jgi:hypothetical protein